MRKTLPVVFLAALMQLQGAAVPAARFADRLAGALTSFAIADGMAAEWEDWTPAEIAARFGPDAFEKFIPPLKERPASNPGKGDGRISDDTLEVEALLRAYAARGDHLDAHGYAEFFVPELNTRRVWVPERAAVMPAAERPLWWPERFALHRHAVNFTDPRQAGQGNWLNQGLAVIIWPVGAVNAGEPARAYAEAAAFGAAHTESYALEASAVTAAAFAEAFGPAPTVDTVLAAALAHAKDGTRLALEAVLAAVDPADEPPVFADKVRRAWLPYAGLAPADLARAAPDTAPSVRNNVGRPSRVQSIESVPAALAAFKWGGGDWRRTLNAGLRYGRDAESIAAVAVGLVGAMHGRAAVPADLASASATANRRDWNAQAAEFAAVVARIAEQDAAAQARRLETVLGAGR